MASKAAQKRLTKEYIAMQREPPPFVWAVPDEKNILTWNFLIRGPPDSPYAGGEYHGVLLFPPEYPFKPPGIKMFTPSGRFQPDRKICFSMSDFHPGTWNPAWSVATILTGLLSFMLSDEMTTGSVTSSDAHKHLFAARSHAWNLSQQRFKDCFPEYCTPYPRDLPNMGQNERGKPESSSVPSTTTSKAQEVSSPPLVASSSRSNASITPPTGTLNLVTASGTSEGASSTGKVEENRKPAASLATTWGRIVWEKWRWGVIIALAVIVSRFSTSA
ncbi:putative UBC-like protein [Lyophyllum shimeji]|uniref:Ubiquitin-conjugating enzyme E2 6 n=1 Tax=Lyophyllum shimeji TaxID=47721 RepID=A0A9P3PXD8_LYOSH|nr:putative UBC-like protein [Lyophyllum shimeji]